MKKFMTGMTLFLFGSLFALSQETSDFNPNNPPEPMTLFTLSLDCDSIQAGTVVGSGNYHPGDKVMLQALPGNEYAFLAWMEGNTIVSAEPRFEYTMPDRNVHLTAHFEFRQKYVLSLGTNPSGITTVSGFGYYESGKGITVSTSTPTNFVFKGWWEADTLRNENSSFQYLMPARSVQLTARFEYSPPDPADPTYEIPKHRLFLMVEPSIGGTLNQTSGVQLLEGASLNIYAYTNSGFVFDGWYRNDSLYQTGSSFNYLMGTADDTLTARFRYDPSSPGDPVPGGNAVYNLTALTQTAPLGGNLAFPVYLFNENLEVNGATFQLNFPSGLVVDYQHASLSSRKNGHTLACDTLGNNLFRFIITSNPYSPLMGSSGCLLTIPVSLPTDWEAGSIHPVFLDSARIGTASGQLNCPVKNGAIQVSSSGNVLYASYYADIYLNRVLFSNLSSDHANTYVWNFGDGQTSTEKNPMHVYAVSGSYDVKLIVSDGIRKDSVRMSVTIASESSWSLKGHYTLNRHKNEVKNFTSCMDMFTTFSRCTITGDVFVQVEPGQTFDMLLNSESDSLFRVIGSRILHQNGPIFTFTSDRQDSVPLMSFTGPLNRSYIQTVMSVAERFRFDKVEMAFSGLKLNVNELNALNVIGCCSGHPTPEADLSKIGNQYDINWSLVNNPLHLSGQLISGSGNIPSMTIGNDTTITDTLIYHLQFISGNEMFYEKKIRYAVQAGILIIPTLLAPASNVGLESPNITFRWRSQEHAFYDLYLWEYGTPEPAVPLIRDIWTGSFTDNTYCRYGKAYKWKILARSACDSVFSAVDSFKIGRLPDLKVESIVLSKPEIYAGESVNVQVRIRNIGGRIFGNYWGDQLYLVSGANHQEKWAVASTWGWKALEADSSYQVTFHVILPLDTVKYTHFLFVADNRLNLAEISDLNNSMFSDTLIIKHYSIDSDEFETLKLLYEKTSGGHWVNHWNFSTDLVISSNWPGVAFQKGSVVSIDLNHNNLKGKLPAQLFNLPNLRTLYLNNNQLSGTLKTLADSMRINHYYGDSLRSLNLGFNLFDGEIAAFANRFPHLTYLNLESNRFSEIDTLLSGNIRELYLQNQLFTHPDIPLEMKPALVLPSLFRYKHDTKELMRKDLSFYLLKNGSNRGWISYKDPEFTLSLNDDWIYAASDSVELVQNNSYLQGSRAKLRLIFPMGDVNIDRQVNILDVQHTLNRIFLEPAYPFNRYAANTFPDSRINVQDIVSTVNLLLASGMVIDTTQQPGLRSASAGNLLYVSGGQLMMENQVPVAALDLSLRNVRENQVRILLNNNDFQYVIKNTQEGARFIVYSVSGKEIPAGLISLAELSTENAGIVGALMANRQAKPVPALIAENWTGQTDVAQTDVQVYLKQHSVTILLNQPTERVTAMLYTLQGALINRQEIGFLNAGSHLMEYPSTLPAGAYLLKLVFRNGNSVLTRNYKWIVSK